MRGNIESRRKRFGETAVALKSLVQLAVVKTARAVTRWQAEGIEGGVADDVEIMQQVGFASRPKAGDAVQMVMLAVGGAARALVGVAARSKTGRPDIAKDETAIHNSKAHVKLDENGDIIIRAYAGQKVYVDDGSGAVPLATLADVQALRDYVATQFLVAGHTHTVSGSVTTAVQAIPAPGVPPPPPPNAPPFPAGTTVLNGK